MSSDEGRTAYSIAAVSKLTGVSCHALRIWERRYAFPIPRRSESGHRRYDAGQVEAILAITRRLGDGAGLAELIAQHRGGLAELPSEQTLAAQDEAAWAGASLAGRLIAGDFAGAEADYRRRDEGGHPAEVAEQLLEPALVEVGERWFRKECAVFQEHQASAFLRRKLDGLLDRARLANERPGRVALVGTVQGDRHECGAMMLALMLELAGWRAVGLGVDLPVSEYRKAIEAWRPHALALSFVLSRNINKRFQELSQLRGAPVFVGGRSILNYQGLARRHGLIPMIGPASRCVGPMRVAADRWHATGTGLGTTAS